MSLLYEVLRTRRVPHEPRGPAQVLIRILLLERPCLYCCHVSP